MHNAIKLPAAGISGHITLRRWSEAHDNDITVGPTCNVITDRLLASRLGDFATVVSIRDALAYCRVGTNNTAPNSANTALVAQVASTNNIVAGPTASASVDDDGRGYVSLVTTYQFGMGAAAGSLKEIGFGSSAAADVLLSRALIKNSSGIPTPLVVTASDYLAVAYELRLYTPWNDNDDIYPSTHIDGDIYNIRIRPIGAASLDDLITADPTLNWTSFNTKEIRHLTIQGAGNNWLGAFEAVEVMPTVEGPWEMGTLTAVLDANTVLAAYVANSKQRSISVTIPAGELNLPGGISYLRLSTSEGSWGMEFVPPLAKVAGKTLTFTVLVEALRHFIP